MAGSITMKEYKGHSLSFFDRVLHHKDNHQRNIHDSSYSCLLVPPLLGLLLLHLDTEVDAVDDDGSYKQKEEEADGHQRLAGHGRAAKLVCHGKLLWGGEELGKSEREERIP